MKSTSTTSCSERLLKWMSMASGERVVDWERVSRGDVVCFILNRMSPGVLSLPSVTDGIDKFARVGNWKIASQAIRKMGMNWNYDEVNLVMADEKELERLLLAIRRWETRYMEEPLDPPSPDEWDENDIPPWFTQQTAKEIEEKRLAMGEGTAKRQRQSVVQEDRRKMMREQRVSIADQMRGIFKKK